MIFTNSEYCRLSRDLLTFCAIWPYQRKCWTKVVKALVSCLFVSGIVVQLCALATREYSLSLLFKILSYTLVKVVYLLKYLTFVFYGNRAREILESIQLDWDTLVGDQEQKLLTKFTQRGRFLGICFTLFCYPPVVAFTTFPFLPVLLDLVAPRNVSRARKVPMIAEYFVDQQRYFYPIAVHILILDMMGGTVVLATETMFIMFIQHCCALFEIASSQIVQIFNPETCEKSISQNHRERLIRAVCFHERALEFFELIRQHFVTSYFLLLGLGVASLSLNLFRLSQALQTYDTEDLLVSPGFIMAHFVYLFLGNYLGQALIDFGNMVSIAAYATKWYGAPKAIKKFLLLLLLRCTRETALVAGGVFTPSLEGFSTLTSMALSYFTVIYSTTQA